MKGGTDFFVQPWIYFYHQRVNVTVGNYLIVILTWAKYLWEMLWKKRCIWLLATSNFLLLVLDLGQKRGHISKNVVVTVTSLETGRVIYFEVLTKYLQGFSTHTGSYQCRIRFWRFSWRMELAELMQQIEVRECLLPLGAEPFAFQFAIQKFKDQDT